MTTLQFLIPAYNEELHLAKTLQSILIASTDRIQILISDNCSTDSTLSICKDFAFRDRRVKIFEQNSNIGPTANMAYLAAHASSDYVQFLGAHDLICTDYVSECLRCIDADAPPYLIPTPMMLLNDLDPSDIKIDTRCALPHSLYYSDDPLIRYIAGVKYWPVNWFYSIIRLDVFQIVFNTLSPFYTINSDHLFISHLLYHSKPYFLERSKIIFRSIERVEKGAYTARLGFSSKMYSGLYQDRLWWMLCYIYHYEKFLNNSNKNDVDKARFLTSGVMAITKLACGGSYAHPFHEIASNIIDYFRRPIRYMD